MASHATVMALTDKKLDFSRYDKSNIMYFSWSFDQNLFKSIIKENDKSYTSRVRKFADKLRYSFTLKPNENGAVWIYFNCITAHAEVKVKLTVSVRFPYEFFSSIDKKLECTFSTSGSYGIELFDNRKILGSGYFGYIFNSLNISCLGDISYKNASINSNWLMGERMLNSGGKDLKIVCGEKQIMVHKSILSTSSPMLTKMIEAQKHENDAIIEIPDCDYEILKYAIDFCYGIAEHFPWSDIDKRIKILHFSAKYEIADLKKEMEFGLMGNTWWKNIWKISKAAIETNAEDLKAVCQSKLIHFIKSNDEFKEIMEEIQTLDKDFVAAVFQNVWVDQDGIFDMDTAVISYVAIFLLAFVSFMFGMSVGKK